MLVSSVVNRMCEAVIAAEDVAAAAAADSAAAVGPLASLRLKARELLEQVQRAC